MVNQSAIPLDSTPDNPPQAAAAATLEEACAQAMTWQLGGHLNQAAQAFQAILEAQPSHAVANYCLGMLEVQQRRADAGLPYLVAALTAHPEVPDYWLGYVEALLQADQGDSAREALASARQHGLSGPAVDELAARLAAGGAPPGRPGAPPLSSAPRTFIVVAPAYDHRSAGIRVLHNLCNELNLCGHVAHLIFYRFIQGAGGLEFFTPADDRGYCSQLEHIPRLPGSTDISMFRALIDDGVVVYPEVLQGNPLNAARVVRYVLNTPAANGRPMLEGTGDFIVSFNSKYWPNPHAIASMFFDEPVFNDHDTRPALQRTMDCTYVGKGVSYGECFRIPGSVSITRNWPEDKEGLATLLRNTRYFFTWDVNSQTNVDAILCGAIIVVPRWAPFTPDIFETDFGPVPYAESHIDNGIIRISHVGPDHESKRRHIIDSINAVTRNRANTVRRLAAEIVDYFAVREILA
jgi:hypothetical protein